MAMRALRVDWIVDMVDELPDDGQKYELIDGKLFVTPSPNDRHQYIVGELASVPYSHSRWTRCSSLSRSNHRAVRAMTIRRSANSIFVAASRSIGSSARTPGPSVAGAVSKNPVRS